MKMTEDRKQAARGAIVDAAGKLFRTQGAAGVGVGVDAIARAIGQTSGAFYAHFTSKAEVFARVAEAGLARLKCGVEGARASGQRAWAGIFAAQYLSAQHCRHVAEGCLLPALPPDIARSPDEVRREFGERLADVAATLAQGCVADGSDEALDRAWVILSLCAGGVMLARAVPDGPVADRILSACRDAARREVRKP